MEKKKQRKKALLRYLGAVVACFCYAMSLNLFIVPNGIVGGGMSGLATLINILTGVGVGLLTMLFNLPVLLMGLKSKGLAFILRCFVTNALLSVMVDAFSFLPSLTDNPLLASIYGGLLQGISIGMFFRCSVSSGGTELLARILQPHFPGLSLGSMLGILDGIIVLTGSFVLRNPQNVLHALIVIFISSQVSDKIITGLNRAKMCYIITEKADEVGEALIKNSPRGVTNLSGVGMFSKAKKNVLMTVVKRHQLMQLKKLVSGVDPCAFVIVSDTTEVLGNGFTGLLD